MIEDQVKYSLDYCPIIEMAPWKKRYFDSFTPFPSNFFKTYDPKDLENCLHVFLPL